MDYNILKKSLKIIASFAENSHALNTADEYLQIHTRNMNMLQEYVVAQKDDFVKELLDSILTITLTDIQNFIDHDRGNKTHYQHGGIITLLYLLIFKRGQNSDDVAIEKIKFIANRNQTILMILENSGF